jgi:hypothetical protein
LCSDILELQAATCNISFHGLASRLLERAKSERCERERKILQRASSVSGETWRYNASGREKKKKKKIRLRQSAAQLRMEAVK